MDLNPQAIIAACVGETMLQQRTYPQVLPADLAPWHCYIEDCGHSILIVVASLHQPGQNPFDSLVPAPVKAVLRKGWTIQDGYVLCDLPYDDVLGLTTDHADDEF